MKLGIDSYSTRNSGLDAVGVLELAGELGLQGVLFELSPFSPSATPTWTTDPPGRAEPRAVRGVRHGLDLPLAPHGRKGPRAAGRGRLRRHVSDAQIVIDHLQVAKKLGSPILRCVAATSSPATKATTWRPWPTRRWRSSARPAGPPRTLGMKIAMENHADFTVRELASILARVNSPAFGFTVDCANLAFDLDDPLRLAGIMAPHALTTHFKNYRVIRTRRAWPWRTAPWATARSTWWPSPRSWPAHNPQINLNIEIHSQFAPFRLDILEETYFQRHPRRRATAWPGTWKSPGPSPCSPSPRPTCPTARSPGRSSWST